MVALLLGMIILGLFTYLGMSTKEAGIEVDRAETDAGQPASLPVRIVVSSGGEVRVDGRPIDQAELANEVSRIIAAAEEASLPEPAFIIAVPEESDNVLLITIMESLAQGGASSISIETIPAAG